jgi:hypothetical protein
VELELSAFGEELGSALRQAGFVAAAEPGDADFVINLLDPANPKPFRRKARGTFVAGIFPQQDPPSDVLEGLRQSYPMLVRGLSNIALCYVPNHGVYFTTMERGHYRVPGNGDLAALAAGVINRLAPLARARLVIDNEFKTDLEPELWNGNEHTEEMIEAGKRLDELGLLPAPFPIEEILGERDLRHVSRLYGIGGLSYGNLSVRQDERRFWMSASGVDKGKLEQPGRDILLVSDYDEANDTMVLSVPPDVEPRRVSVDAIEHWMIYQHHPDVKAILHVHAWIDGIPATEVNYPCGTAELAVDVSRLVDAEEDPSHAVIGLMNHGITATGESLTEILDRILPVLQRQVPMA